MDAMEIGGTFVGEGIYVKGVGGEINDTRAGDADFRRDVVIRAVTIGEVVVRHHGGSSKVCLPDESAVRAGIAVGVKGINAVVLSGDENNIVCSLTRDGEAGDVKGLAIGLTVEAV